MEEVECRAPNSFRGTTPRHWVRYVDVQTFTEHINSVVRNIQFTGRTSGTALCLVFCLFFWTVPFRLKKTGAFTLEDTGNGRTSGVATYCSYIILEHLKNSFFSNPVTHQVKDWFICTPHPEKAARYMRYNLGRNESRQH